MNKAFFLHLSAALILGAATSRAATLIVDDSLQCPGAQLSTIQAAINAASPGDTIKICPGTYPEQVRIDKNLTVEGIPFGNENLVLLMPGAVTANSSSLVSGMPFAAIILVDGASKVDLSNLTVDGANNGLASCAINFAGIYYRNSSGKIDSVVSRNIQLPPGGDGCQTGLGIFAQSSANGATKLEVTNSSLHDYQKNGIVANEPNTELTAKNNAITGVGPIFTNTQNGIQIGFGAQAKIEENAILNHIFAGCSSAAGCSTISTGIFLFQAGRSVSLSKNTIGKSQTGVFLQSDQADVKDNIILDSDVFNGVAVLGAGNKVEKNSIFNSDGGAIAVVGDRNKIDGNNINEAPAGVVLSSDAVRNRVNGNTFYNTIENVVVLDLGATKATSDENAAPPTVEPVRF